MPMYEGIGLINEKHPVVLEIGNAFVKAGFAGENSPRCMIPSSIRSKDGTGFRRLVDFKDETDLYQMFVEFLHHLYCRYLLVTPKDRKIVVVESLFATTLWRQTLAKVLYLHYEILSVLWIPNPIAAVSATGYDTALTIDFGAEEVQVVPVFKGVTILNAVICHELGANAFDKNLKNLLVEGCLNKTKEEILPILTTDRVEDIRVRCCAVTSSSRAKRLLEDNDPKNFRTLSYELDGENFVKFNGSVRELAAELWFQNYDLDGVSIPQMVLQVLSNCPVDTRKELAERILITGGTGMLPGLKGRLLKELKSIVTSADNLLDPVLQERFINSNYTFKIYDPPVKENCVNWLGGALYGATEAMSLRGVSKEFFLKHGLIPDWCDLQFDMFNALNSSGISAYGISSGISRGYNS